MHGRRLDTVVEKKAIKSGKSEPTASEIITELKQAFTEQYCDLRKCSRAVSDLLCLLDFDNCSEKNLFIAFRLSFEVNLISRAFSVASPTRHSRDWKFRTEPYRI